MLTFAAMVLSFGAFVGAWVAIAQRAGRARRAYWREHWFNFDPGPSDNISETSLRRHVAQIRTSADTEPGI